MPRTENTPSDNSSPAIDRRSFLKQGGTVAAVAAMTGLAANEAFAAKKKDKKPAKEDKSILRVAMLSGWHAHAKGYAKTLAAMPDVKITSVWDEKPDRGAQWAKSLNAPFEADLNKVLKRSDVDAVAITAPTNRHAEIMIAAAKAGKHIFTEKVMALTIDECNSIAEAVRAANVRFCISFPYRTRPETLYAKKAVEDGLLGELTFLRVRVAHDGGCGGWLPEHFWDPVQCGGGAMMDLGAHPMYLARWIGGQPVRIVSAFTRMTKHEVEDNAVSVIEFENGCLGVAETSFMSTDSPFSLELSGTEGSLVVGGPDEGSVRIKSKKLDKKEWTTPAPLPEALPPAIKTWVDGILKGTPITFGLEEGIQLTELMQYAYVASKEKRQVDIPKR
jgi:1,5-anhydro-D-fructose reductase (1,5-anhydro-D-mannitol-forming)